MTETMKTLQRWKCHHEYIEKVEGNEWGDWVSYDDAAKLLAENERLCAEVQTLSLNISHIIRERDETFRKVVDARDDALTEVERLRAENTRMATNIERLGAEMKQADLIRAENSRLGSDNRYYRNKYAEKRAEVERLRAERDALRIAAREYLQTAGGAIQSGKFDMTGTADTAHFTFELVGTTDMAHVMRQAMQRLYSLAFDRAEPCPAGLETLREPDKEDGR